MDTSKSANLTGLCFSRRQLWVLVVVEGQSWKPGNQLGGSGSK
jgi:hypothetical protein